MRSELNCPGFEMAARRFEPCSFRLRVHLLKAVLLQCCRTAVLTIISSATEKKTFTKHKLYNGIYPEHGIYPCRTWHISMQNMAYIENMAYFENMTCIQFRDVVGGNIFIIQLMKLTVGIINYKHSMSTLKQVFWG